MAERIRVVARAFPEAHREQQEALVVVSASECAASASSALDPEMTPPIAFVRKIAAFAAIATRTVLRVPPPTDCGIPAMARAETVARRAGARRTLAAADGRTAN